MQAKREVYILEVGAELPGKTTDAAQDITAIKAAGAARSEDRTCVQVFRSKWLAMPPLAGNATQIVAVAGAIDARSAVSLLPPQHERRHRGQFWVRKVGQRGVCPA